MFLFCDVISSKQDGPLRLKITEKRKYGEKKEKGRTAFVKDYFPPHNKSFSLKTAFESSLPLKVM